KEKSPRPFSTTTVGLPFPVQFTWSLCPPRSTNFPDGCGRVAGSAADALITTRHAIIAAQKHLNVMAVIVSDRRLLTWASRHCLRRLTPVRNQPREVPRHDRN